jgi:hypothetical protein
MFWDQAGGVGVEPMCARCHGTYTSSTLSTKYFSLLWDVAFGVLELGVTLVRLSDRNLGRPLFQTPVVMTQGGGFDSGLNNKSTLIGWIKRKTFIVVYYESIKREPKIRGIKTKIRKFIMKKCQNPCFFWDLIQCFFRGLVHKNCRGTGGRGRTAVVSWKYSLRRKRHTVHEQLAAWRTNRSAASPQVGDLAFHPLFLRRCRDRRTMYGYKFKAYIDCFQHSASTDLTAQVLKSTEWRLKFPQYGEDLLT